MAEAAAVAVLGAQHAERRAQFPCGVRARLLDGQQRGRDILAALACQVHRHASLDLDHRDAVRQGIVQFTGDPQPLFHRPAPGGAFLPTIAMVVAGASLSNVVLLPKLGPKPLVTAGMLLAAGSLVWLTRIGLHSGYASALLGPMMAAGLGFGFTIAPSMNTGTFGVAPQDAGVASATLNTGQQIGGSIGTSLLNTIFAGAVAQYLTSHLSRAALIHGHPAPALTAMSLIHGYTTAFWVAAAIFGVGAVTCGTLFRSGPLRASGAAAAAPAGASPRSSPSPLPRTSPTTLSSPGWPPRSAPASSARSSP